MSTKKDLKTGAIFEIELDKGTGFGYVKLLRSADIDPTVQWKDFIVKPYNIYSQRAMKNSFRASDFETDDLICFPLLMYFRPKLRGKDAWKFIGTSQLTEEDLVIPDYLEPGWELSRGDNLKRAFESDKSFTTYYVKNLMNKREPVQSFDSIKHLGHLPHTSPSSINRFITMHWKKENGDDPLELYRQYANGEYHSNPEIDGIGGGIDLFSRDNDSFRKMTRIKRLKYWTGENTPNE